MAKAQDLDEIFEPTKFDSGEGTSSEDSESEGAF
jgi:hypothetical protein